MAERIISVNMAEQHKKDITEYAIYVLLHRVMPDRRDGLKPVQRRILFSMFYLGSTSYNTKIKSARIVGEVMGKYHPHGDSSIYGAMKPLINWFEINMALISKHGDFGNFNGDEAAAPRYTEAFLSKFAMDCVISELKETKNAVDWCDNFDRTEVEPKYLPAALPIVLINGAFGIGVGVKVEIPKHNVGDVIDATVALIKDKNASIKLIPEHCMPCDIVNTDFKSISNKGFGSYIVRGIIDIEIFNNPKISEYNGRTALVIRSTPDLVFLNSIKDKVEELISTNKIVQIQDYVDLSTEFEMKFMYILKKGADPNFVRQVIYKNTEMEKSCRVNFEVLDGEVPLRMSYKSYLLSFIEFRKVTKFRLYCNKIQELETKVHPIDAFIKVLQSGEIDNIVNLIRTATNKQTILDYLINKIKLTPLQADFISGVRLDKLAIYNLNAYIEESKALHEKIDGYINYITNDNLIEEEIIQELLEFKKKYNVPRRCRLISESEVSGIPEGEFKIVITNSNFIKKIQVADTIGSMKGDSPKYVIKGENTENILLFDDMGKVFKLPIHKIMFTEKGTNGIDIRMLIKNLTANINTVIYEPTVKSFNEKQNKYFLVAVTAGGNIKKMDLDDFLTVPPSGIVFMKLDDGDFIKDIMIIPYQSDVIVYSDSKALRMNMEDIPHLKRATKGSKAMNVNEMIDGISVIKHDTTDIVVITELGRVNRFSPVALPYLGRNKTGSTVIKLSKGDKIKCIYGLNIEDTIRIITKETKIEIPVKDIQEGSSISTGVKMISTKTDIILRCDIIKNK
jgi:DNA gyrase subunit A